MPFVSETTGTGAWPQLITKAEPELGSGTGLWPAAESPSRSRIIASRLGVHWKSQKEKANSQACPQPMRCCGGLSQVHKCWRRRHSPPGHRAGRLGGTRQPCSSVSVPVSPVGSGCEGGYGNTLLTGGSRDGWFWRGPGRVPGPLSVLGSPWKLYSYRVGSPHTWFLTNKPPSSL